MSSPEGEEGPRSADSTRKRQHADFVFGTILGEGSYSTVIYAQEPATGKEYAVKVLDKRHIIKEKKVKYVSIEKDVLNRLNEHPFVVKLYYSFQDSHSLYFVLEFAKNGDMLGFIRKLGAFDLAATRWYAAEIVSGVEYIHSHNVIHRDLKPENILLSDDMHIKITDFGTAKILDQPQTPIQPTRSLSVEGEEKQRNSFVGTAEYCSPELLNDRAASTASDVWAIGVIIYQLLAGRHAFKASNEYQTFQKITKLDYAFPDGFPPVAKDLVSKILVLNPDMRPSISEIKQHAFFEGIDWALLHTTSPPKLVPFLPAISNHNSTDLVSDYAVQGDGLEDEQGTPFQFSAAPPDIDDPFRKEGDDDDDYVDGITPALGNRASVGAVLASLPGSPLLTANSPISPDGRIEEYIPLGVTGSPTWRSSAARPPSGNRPAARSNSQPMTPERQKTLERQQTSVVSPLLRPNEVLMKYATVNKRKGLFSKRRGLILTDTPRLFFYDEDKIVARSEVPLGHGFRVELKDARHFFLHSPRRTYYLEDMTGHADVWASNYRPHKNGVDDLVLLTDLTESAIVDTLRKHYDSSEIYTYIGPVLISVNPFQDIPNLYSQQTLMKYPHKFSYENPPHVFALAEDVHRSMLKEKSNHCVIISGESGAGKTEAAKKIMSYIAAVTPADSRNSADNIKTKLLQSNPVLEAFGNAKTLRNDNSSRFGKYMEMEFSYSGAPTGGKILDYLLEKSRVVQQQSGERNFHIFYQILAGSSSAEKSQLQLFGPEYYRYLNQSNCVKVSGVNDASDFKEVRDAMKSVGLGQTEITDILHLLAGVLHIGNLEFTDGSKDVLSKVSNHEVLAIAAGILKVQPAQLEKALVNRTIFTNNERISTPLKPNEAALARDSLAKNIYARMFKWIIARLNENLASSEAKSSNTIGVLDIYGFEIFERNSFEQLCINYANEKLHQIFIELSLKAEQEEYVREGIPWQNVQYLNNKPCCELIEKQHHLIDLLDEECVIPNGSDASLHDKLLKNLKGKPHWVQPPASQNSQKIFQIAHYASNVTYECSGFLEKNRDTLFVDLVELMNKSSMTLGKTLFADAMPDKNSKKRPVTAGAQFRTQVGALVTSLMSSVPYYIRCIKPNATKSAKRFDQDLVVVQVQYLGLLENVKVRRAGYAFRRSFNLFLQRYKMLTSTTWPFYRGDESKGCSIIMQHLSIAATEFKIGKTKIFVKSPTTIFKLEELRDAAVEKLVVKIQRTYRAYVMRRWFLELRALTRELVYGNKERRRASLERKYRGEYIEIRKGDFQSIMKRHGDSRVLFADNVKKLNRSFKFDRRVLVITDKNIHWFAFESGRLSHHKFLLQDHLTGVSLSEYSDNFMCIHASRATNGGARQSLVFESEHKTEITVALKEHFSAKGRDTQLEFKFVNSISFEFEKGQTRTLRFQKGTFLPLKVTGTEAVVSVEAGLPKTTDIHMDYVPMKHRKEGATHVGSSSRTLATSNETVSQTPRPVWAKANTPSSASEDAKNKPEPYMLKKISSSPNATISKSFNAPPASKPQYTPTTIPNTQRPVITNNATQIKPVSAPPSNTVVPQAPVKRPAPPPPRKTEKRVKAIYSFEPRAADELKIVENKEYVYVGEADAGWSRLKDTVSSREGLVPSNYFEPL
ncbi:hypothetical protein SmJEL517_g00731 [Synchytrium microbalum]|uniref:non-specific serine/threonine protein kinase n=1 Tax=Synchytrium microbalum TaxID=1806994 RepID=A0A507CEC0_9FUNG|nr:uncharacterized protein SmJEL517_g00731 [Synchytrium microbalum]TPX37698.1 hypothetical protein SmJEL517_g00731 [Synchytrium microbalum]